MRTSTASLKARLARLQDQAGQCNGVPHSAESARRRNDGRLQWVAGAPPRARKVAIQIAVRGAVQLEEPRVVQDLIDALGRAEVERVFPDGLPDAPIEFFRRRAREWLATKRDKQTEEDPISRMLKEHIRQQQAGRAAS
jgi:hypothetical protein